ncbi:MAG: methyltransferase [Ignavibacteriae bacterium]|nr:MAG: methyltransferase [Ignavibacteriota bacterium]
MTIEISEQDRKYWQYEYDVVAKYLLPLLKKWGFESRNQTLLDVGCGDGGGVAAFYDAGFDCKGFDIEIRRVQLANLLKGERKYEMVTGNIYDDNFPYSNEIFDLIVLHDVIEHLENKTDVLIKLKKCLSESGKILITFPPYYSAFGAHQQLLNSTILKLPYMHLFPFYKNILLTKNNENQTFVKEIIKLMNLKMGIKKFEDLLDKCNLKIDKKINYIIGPNHIRFGLKPLSLGIFGNIPLINEIITNGIVYLLRK